jgi:hypothetical protein
MPEWGREVAAVSKGQSARCKAAIHRYWLASGKVQRLEVRYLAAHAHITATKLSSDLQDEPFTTLQSLTDEAKSSAIRICG